MIIFKELITELNSVLRTIITNVHYLVLPDQSFLEKQSIVYTLTNNDNESTFEKREILKTFQLVLRVNSAKTTKASNNNELEKLVDIIDPIKNKIYKLGVNHVRLITEDLFFDPELDVYTFTYVFELKIQSQN